MRDLSHMNTLCLTQNIEGFCLINNSTVIYYMVSTALSQCSPTHTLLHGIYCSITMLTNTHSTTWYLLLYHNAHQHTLYYMVSTALSQCSPTHTLLHGIYCSITMLTNTQRRLRRSLPAAAGLSAGLWTSCLGEKLLPL